MKILHVDFNNAADGTLPPIARANLRELVAFNEPIVDGGWVWLTDDEIWTRAIFCCEDGILEARSGNF